MNRAEVAKLLTIAAQVDNRKIDDLTITVWAGIIGDLPFAEAADAIRNHFRNSREYLTPQHIRAGVDAIRTERFEADPDRMLGAAPVILGPDHRGTKIVKHVMDGLARARAANGGKLGRERSAALGEQLMREALERFPPDAPPATRGAPCGRLGCRCTHDVDPTTGERCDGGWVEITSVPEPDPAIFGDPVEHRDAGQVGMVRKCPVCDLDGSERVAAAVSRHGGDTARLARAAARWSAQASLRQRKRGKS